MNRTLFLFISLFAAVAFFSCKKSTDIGSDVLPTDDSIGVHIVSLGLNTKTVREDSLATYNLDKYILGFMHDDIFGTSTAGIFTQFRPSNSGVNFKDCYLDSVVLCLVYHGDKNYGDVTSEVSAINVYRLNEPMNSTETYYSNKEFGFDAVAVGNKPRFVPDFTDSVDEFDSKATMIRIRLDDQFGKNFLEQDSASFATTAAFQSFFKGLYISPDETVPGKGLVYLKLDDVNTRLTLYYHSFSATVAKHFNFVIGSGCAHTNNFKHDYTGYPVEKTLTSTAASDSIVYVQSMAGLKTKITIPDLKSLGKILVNKAEFVMTQVFDETMDNVLNKPPVRMWLVASDSSGRNIAIPDIISNNYSYGGAKTDFTNSNGKTVARYSFNIADRMQEVVNKLNNGDSDYGLFLIVFQAPELADRIVVGGNNRKDSEQLKLTLTYTKLQ